VLSKSDTVTEKELEDIIHWSEEPESLYDALTTGQMSPSSVQSIELLKAMESVGMYNQIVPVSSEEPNGLEDVYNAIQQSMEGGEDIRSD
jgi:hypothetical protein